MRKLSGPVSEAMLALWGHVVVLPSAAEREQPLRRMTRLASAAWLALVALACAERSGRRAETGDSAPAAAPRVAPAAHQERPDSAPRAENAWFAEADSALRVHLARSLYLSTPRVDPGFRECAGDEGSDNPPSLVAAARARIVGHDSLSTETAFEYGDADARTKYTTFNVEVLSAARMIPAWILEITSDTGVPADQAYGITATPQVDTFEVTIEDLGPLTPRWAVCAPTLGHAPGYQFWAFAHAGDDWVKPIRWTPSTASWARVRALADSLASAPQ